MLESPRWIRRAGTGLAVIGTVVVVASTTAGAGATPWEPPPCRDVPTPIARPPGSLSWFRLDPLLDDGASEGQRLTIGQAGMGRPRMLTLPVESFAAGPFGGRILVGADDGTTSRLSLIDIERLCQAPLAAAAQVIRRATISPDGRSLYEFRVDRSSRADLGVWRRDLDAPATASPALPPIEPDERFGPTWSTEFAWSLDGARLAVQSCGELACRTRVLELASGAVDRVDHPHLGPMVGLTRDRLLARGACAGLPCPITSVHLDDGTTVSLAVDAGSAVLAVDDDGRPWVVHEVGAVGPTLRSVAVDGADAADLPADPDGYRLALDPSRSGDAADIAPGWVVLAPDGRLPLEGTPARLRSVTDGRTAPFDEVPR
jgi:hypothetical protein